MTDRLIFSTTALLFFCGGVLLAGQGAAAQALSAACVLAGLATLYLPLFRPDVLVDRLLNRLGRPSLPLDRHEVMLQKALFSLTLGGVAATGLAAAAGGGLLAGLGCGALALAVFIGAFKLRGLISSGPARDLARLLTTGAGLFGGLVSFATFFGEYTSDEFWSRPTQAWATGLAVSLAVMVFLFLTQRPAGVGPRDPRSPAGPGDR